MSENGEASKIEEEDFKIEVKLDEFDEQMLQQLIARGEAMDKAIGEAVQKTMEWTNLLNARRGAKEAYEVMVREFSATIKKKYDLPDKSEWNAPDMEIKG